MRFNAVSCKIILKNRYCFVIFDDFLLCLSDRLADCQESMCRVSLSVYACGMNCNNFGVGER